MHTMLRVPDMVPVSNGSFTHAHPPYIYIFQAFVQYDMCIYFRYAHMHSGKKEKKMPLLMFKQ